MEPIRENRLYIGLGYMSLGLGVIGIFMPIMPTAPFVILAAWLFSKGSPRLHKWMLSQPRLGPMIMEWEQYKVIRPLSKLFSVTVISVSFSYVIFVRETPQWLNILMAIIGCSSVAFIVSRRNYPPRP